jgi:DNA polymerase III alpha subunit (gram-positive type)
MTDDSAGADKKEVKPEAKQETETQSTKVEFTAVLFEQAWTDFLSQLNGEGTRIVSMFKAIKPEVENDQTVRIHLSNAAQKDTFVLNYKQRLLNFLETRFIMTGVDVETAVDLTEATDILYTDEQKYTHMVNKYPVLKDMKKSFNLDLT